MDLTNIKQNVAKILEENEKYINSAYHGKKDQVLIDKKLIDIERKVIERVDIIIINKKFTLFILKNHKKLQTSAPIIGDIITPVRLPPIKFSIVVLSRWNGFVWPRYRAVDIREPTTPPILPPFSTTWGTKAKTPGKETKNFSPVLKIVPDTPDKILQSKRVGILSFKMEENLYFLSVLDIPMIKNAKKIE